MSWTAILPLKLGAERKSRLADRLAPQERAALSDAMAAHVLSCVRQSPLISRLVALAPQPIAGVAWREDLGRGLNAELEAARAELGVPLLVVFGDLPMLSPADIEALVIAAQSAGVALAPDRRYEGTNAAAIARDSGFRFRFGQNSFALHREQAPEAAIVDRVGLSHDVDTPDDLDAVTALGWRSKRADDDRA